MSFCDRKFFFKVVISMAHRLGIKVVAEGVETEVNCACRSHFHAMKFGAISYRDRCLRAKCRHSCKSASFCHPPSHYAKSVEILNAPSRLDYLMATASLDLTTSLPSIVPHGTRDFYRLLLFSENIVQRYCILQNPNALCLDHADD